MIIKERRYTLRRYLLGALPARIGDEMSGQAILLLGLGVFHDARQGSALLAALTISATLGGPLVGGMLDHARNPGRILAATLFAYACGLSILSLSLGHAPFAFSLLIALSAGFFMPAISGGWSSRLTSFIADEHMVRASAIDATTFNIAGLVGPAMAGLVVIAFNAYWAMAILVLFLLLALPVAYTLPKHSVQNGQHELSFLRLVTAGFTVILSNKDLLRITLTSVISYMGIGMLWIICPLVGQVAFGSVGYGGVLMTILSIGALVATIAYAKWPSRFSPDKITFLTTLMLSLAMLILALSKSSFGVIIAMLLAGLADGPQLAAIFAVRHREAPERLRSQVFTTGASLKITAAAIGASIAGQLAASSLRITIMAAVSIQMLAAIAFLTASKMRSKPKRLE
jgi:MFS family permease